MSHRPLKNNSTFTHQSVNALARPHTIKYTFIDHLLDPKTKTAVYEGIKYKYTYYLSE